MEQTVFRAVLRDLVHCYQAFEARAGAHIHRQGLTIPQFDILVTLGNGGRMTPKELVEHTLITKGTLTGVIDRLLIKGVISRTPSPVDGRSYVIQLTPKGRRLFERIFPDHLAHMSQAFDHLQLTDMQKIQTGLNTLHHALELENNSPT